MYRVIVIDDEARVRRGLSQLIPSLDPEWEVVGQAKNGHEGLELVKKHLPDLVITDIRMPKMNGLDLLNHLRGYPVRVVVLSGYGYFEYAQTAIKFGAFDFLLKPAKSDEIAEVLMRVKSLEQMSMSQDERNPIKDYSFIWEDWLSHPEKGGHPPEELRDFFPADGQHFYVVKIEIDNMDELITDDQWGDRQLVIFAARNVMADVVHDVIDSEVTYMLTKHSALYFLVQVRSSVRDLAFHIVKSVRKWLKVSISIGISDPHASKGHVHQAVDEADQALQNKWIYGYGSVSEFADFRIEEVLLSGYPIKLEEKLVNAIKLGEDEQALQHLQQFMDMMIVDKVTFRLFHRFYLQLVSSIIRILYEYQIYEIVLQDHGQPYELLEVDVPLHEFHTKLKRLIVATIEAMAWVKIQKNERTMRKVLEFIHQNFMDDLSLDDVSQEIRMSASYFSTFFKQEQGVSFVEYLTHLRIEKAKQLMGETFLKIYEISERVGYADVKYFSRVFKRVVGVTPSEYREFFFRNEVE